MVVVVEVVDVEPIRWLQGTGAEWQEEQEESFSEQLESKTQTLPITSVPSYLNHPIKSRRNHSLPTRYNKYRKSLAHKDLCSFLPLKEKINLNWEEKNMLTVATFGSRSTSFSSLISQASTLLQRQLRGPLIFRITKFFYRTHVFTKGLILSFY